jgi:hypothetical protein
MKPYARERLSVRCYKCVTAAGAITQCGFAPLRLVAVRTAWGRRMDCVTGKAPVKNFFKVISLIWFLAIAGSSSPAAAARGIYSGQTCSATCTGASAFVNANVASGNIVVNLPVSNATFNPIEICKTDSSLNTVTLMPNGSDTINQ